MLKPLKYIGYAIVFQEVPNEIALAINISGCPHACEGCHSEYLWEYDGEYLKDNIDSLMYKYCDYITCVCFMGGDQNINELYELCKHVKSVYSLKTCIYSGLDSIDVFNDFIKDRMVDYLKIGSYKKELGGLDSETTNQRIYIVDDGCLINITKKMRHNHG